MRNPIPPGLLGERRLGVADILGLSLGVQFAYFKYFAAVCVVAYLPIAIFSGAYPTDGFESILMSVAGGKELNADAIGSAALYGAVSAVLNIIFEPLSICAACHIAERSVSGEPVTFESLTDASLRKWGKTAFASLLRVCVVSILTMVFVVPGIIAGVYLCLTETAAAVTDISGPSALSESVKITRGRFFRTLGFVLAVLALSVGISWMFMYMPVGETGVLTAVLSAAFGIACQILLSFGSVAFCLYYLNIKLLERGITGRQPE